MSGTRAALVAASVVAILSSLLLAPTAQAAQARTLTSKATPTAALAGAKVTFTGKVTHSPRNSNVKLQRKSGKKWVTVKTVHTKNLAGAYSAVVALPARAAVYVYRAWAPSFEGLKTAYSKNVSVTALRKTTFFHGPIYPMQSPGVPIADSSDMTVVASLKAPCTGGGQVRLQKKVGSTWSTLASAAVGAQAGGVCAIQVTGHDAHSGTYRLLVDRRGLNASVASPARAFETKV